MKKYTSDELVVLLNKVIQCFYSLNQMNLFSRPYINDPAGTLKATEQDAFRMDYYREKFVHEISELYSFFYDKGDEKILNAFHASEEERLKLKKVRHKVAHIDGDLEKSFQVSEAFLESTKPANQIKDVIVIVMHLRFIFSLIGQEHFVIDHIKMILSLYSPDFVSPSILKQLIG